MGAFLAIVANEVLNTNMQEHQDIDSSSLKDESIRPVLYTNLVYMDRTPESFKQGCMYVERIQRELNDDYKVRLRDGIRILVEWDIATQTPEAFRN